MKIELLQPYGFSKDKIHPKYFPEGTILEVPKDISEEQAKEIVKANIAKVAAEAPTAPPVKDPDPDKGPESKSKKGSPEDKSVKGAPEDKGK